MNSRNLEYVGFWPRFGATVIDLLLQLAITLPLTYAVYGRISSPGGKLFMGLGDALINLVLPAAAIVAFWVYKSATPGKLAIAASVVDADTGLPLSTQRSLVRYMGYYVSLIPFGVGYIWIAFDPKKQGWHDKMANSVVVRTAGKMPVVFAGQPHWSKQKVDPRP